MGEGPRPAGETGHRAGPVVPWETGRRTHEGSDQILSASFPFSSADASLCLPPAGLVLHLTGWGGEIEMKGSRGVWKAVTALTCLLGGEFSWQSFS